MISKKPFSGSGGPKAIQHLSILEEGHWMPNPVLKQINPLSYKKASDFLANPKRNRKM